MKNYIDSEQHWEDSVNADYDYKEAMEKEQEDNRVQPTYLNHNNIPVKGTRYSIIENNIRIFGKVGEQQGNTNRFWVKWEDEKITLENNIDNCIMELDNTRQERVEELG